MRFENSSPWRPRAQVLAILISRKLPKVYAQIQRFQTPTSLITMAWSLTGYLSVFPFEVRAVTHAAFHGKE